MGGGPNRAREGRTVEDLRAERDAAAELDAGLAGTLDALGEHLPARGDAPAAPAGQPDDGFADIWDAFAQLRDALGLPETVQGAEAAAQSASQDRSGPVSASVFDDAIAEARACAAWYRDTPEWQRITQVTDAARALVTAIRGAAGDYWDDISRDVRVRGFIRTVTARTSRAVSGWAGILAGKLEEDGRRDTLAWRAMSRLHRVAAACAGRVIGYLPPDRTQDRIRDAERIIGGVCQQQRQAAGSAAPASASPAGLAALGFPAPAAPVTTAVTSQAPRPAATKATRRASSPGR